MMKKIFSALLSICFLYLWYRFFIFFLHFCFDCEHMIVDDFRLWFLFLMAFYFSEFHDKKY
uniref:Uncharacterized protein n=1 Tax=Monodopsis sp. MarTras21 TaxID=1745953 RepID=A0A140F2Z6_9STRA|nr:hypothetical protein [Monodopsis sp. MarTras21]